MFDNGRKSDVDNQGEYPKPALSSAEATVGPTPLPTPLTPDQVWPLTQLFPCFLFVKKSWICLDGKSMTPHRRNTILCSSSQQLPCLRLVLCFRNYRDTRTLSGAEVPGNRQLKLTQILIGGMLQTHFFTPILDFEKSTE